MIDYFSIIYSDTLLFTTSFFAILACLVAILITKATPDDMNYKHFKKIIYFELGFGILTSFISPLTNLELLHINGIVFWHIQRLSKFEFNIAIQIFVSIFISFGNYFDITFLTTKVVVRNSILWHNLQLNNKKVCRYIFTTIFVTFIGVFANGFIFFDRIQMPMPMINVSISETQTTLENLFSKSIAIRMDSMYYTIITVLYLIYFSTNYLVIFLTLRKHIKLLKNMKHEIQMSSKTKLAANSFTRSFIITAAVPFFIVGIPLFMLTIISIYFGNNSVVHHPVVIIRLLSLSPMINSLSIIFVISSNRKIFFKFLKKLIGKDNNTSVKVIKGPKYDDIPSQRRNIIHNKKKVILY